VHNPKEPYWNPRLPNTISQIPSTESVESEVLTADYGVLYIVPKKATATTTLTTLHCSNLHF